MKREERQRRIPLARLLILAAALLVLAALMLLRWRGSAEAPRPSAVPTPTEEAVPAAVAPAPEETPAETSAPSPEPTQPAPEPTPSQETPTPSEPVRVRELSYTKKTYDLVSDMVYTYRHLQENGMDTVERDLEQLKQQDAAMGELWQGIMDCWRYTNTEIPVNTAAIPDTLPQDGSLAIVVLGFELLADGGMTPELQGRCELALRCAEQYPQAPLVLCGGCTALIRKEVSEAGVMADWLVGKGIERERLILEDRSMTTADNAQYACRILAVRYPQVKSLLLVTSDYHVPLATLLFTEAALLWEQEYGARPYTVADNAALATPGRPDYEGTTKSAEYLWSMADPHYY